MVDPPAVPWPALPPHAAVAAELLHALADAALLPARLVAEHHRRERLRAELRELLGASATPRPEQPRALPEGGPLRLVVSCAEASGEVHAVALVRALRAHLAAAGAPKPRVVGLAGPRLAAEDVPLIARPVERAAMGFDGALGALPYWLGVLRDAARLLRTERPDVFVPVDSPALHVPLARIARRYGIPVVHHVTPQHWGWASWRARTYARTMTRALSILPFEPAWFARRGVAVEHVGHPHADALAALPAAAAVEPSRAIAVLPGSRAGVIARNLPFQLAVIAEARRSLGPFEALVLQEDEAHRALVERLVRRHGGDGPVAVRYGGLHAALGRVRAALSVSGTVLLDLLHHRLPTVVVYALSSRRLDWARRHLLLAPYFASPNLLAGREVFPEHAFRLPGPVERVSRDLVRCYNDPDQRARVRAGLEEAHRRLGGPGAARRAAAAVIEVAAERRRRGGLL